MQKTENSIKISDVVNSLKNTNLLSDFGNNCDFLKQSLILFYNLTSSNVKIQVNKSTGNAADITLNVLIVKPEMI